ncbi:MAG: Rpn family recombination-promoting nuclease/putative transposase [Lachnospiraceae bacterium]|nr:Rpn family recombination-promoting nuclease/putative transposase [Lachnospiraceae bacterium]
MGKFDILDKKFFGDRERFAELINTELYHGKEILVPDRLKLLKRSYPSLASSSGEKVRDVLMQDTGQNICYGLEIETESDYSMPERVMTYDASEYEYQIREIYKAHRDKGEYKKYRDKKSRLKESDFLIPTVTIVLYIGEGHWEGKMKLWEMFRVSEQVKHQLGRRLWDYDFPLIETEYVQPEKYCTDLREFFQAMQCRRDKKQLKELCQTERFRKLSRETERVIAVHLGNDRLFEQVEEGMPMCKALDDWMKEEREIGRAEERHQTMQKMLQVGLEEDLIMSILNCTKEELVLAEAGR